MTVGRNIRGEQRRAAVLGATIKLAAAEGLEAVSISRVAGGAATRKSLILYHFRTRDELMAAAIEFAVARCKRARKPMAQLTAATGGDPREQLKRWIDGAFCAAEALDAWVFLLQVNARRAPVLGAHCAVAGADERERELAEILLRGHRQQCWHTPNATQQAATTAALLDGIVLGLLRTGATDLEQAASRCRRLVLDTLIGV